MRIAGLYERKNDASSAAEKTPSPVRLRDAAGLSNDSVAHETKNTAEAHAVTIKRNAVERSTAAAFFAAVFIPDSIFSNLVISIFSAPHPFFVSVPIQTADDDPTYTYRAHKGGKTPIYDYRAHAQNL